MKCHCKCACLPFQCYGGMSKNQDEFFGESNGIFFFWKTMS